MVNKQQALHKKPVAWVGEIEGVFQRGTAWREDRYLTSHHALTTLPVKHLAGITSRSLHLHKCPANISGGEVMSRLPVFIDHKCQKPIHGLHHFIYSNGNNPRIMSFIHEGMSWFGWRYSINFTNISASRSTGSLRYSYTRLKEVRMINAGLTFEFQTSLGPLKLP